MVKIEIWGISGRYTGIYKIIILWGFKMEIKNIFELIDFYNKYVFADEIIKYIEPEILPEYFNTHLHNMFYVSGLFKKYGDKIKSINFDMDELLPDYIYIYIFIYPVYCTD